MSSYKTYEVSTDGETFLLDEVTETVHADSFLHFYSISRATGQKELVRAFHADTVLAFRLVPEQERPVTPKHLYRVTFVNGSETKLVWADLYRIAAVGGSEHSVYEFFSKTGDRETREELTVPYLAVKFVERVDEEKTTAAVKAVPVEDLPMPGGSNSDESDFTEVVRPKRH